MKLNYFLIFIIVAGYGCSSEKKDKEKTDPVNKNSKEIDEPYGNEITASPVTEGSNYIPFEPDYVINASGQLSINLSDDLIFEGKIKWNNDSVDFIKFDASALIAKISPVAKRHPFHQKLNVYLFEKQWQKDSLSNEGSRLVDYYEVINPPTGNTWFLNAIVIKDEQKHVFASFRMEISDRIYKRLFKKFNPDAEESLADFRTVPPDIEKIDYNRLRKMGKFYEGFAASAASLKFDPQSLLSSSFLVRKNKPVKLSHFIENDFEVPVNTEFGYDTLHFTSKSLRDLYTPATFTYKTSYNINGGKDSLLEMQIDFKTKEGVSTVRLVMGGINFQSLKRLETDDFANSTYFPLGFSTDENNPDAFVFMGNMSGYWNDNSIGRNIDGVKINYDKYSPTRIHIWLIGGDGFIPVAHYIANLDAFMMIPGTRKYE